MSIDPGLLAAVDMGSNSFRLEIGRISGDRYRRHAYFKETVRLGAGLDDQGRLTEEAAGRGLACLERFAREMRDFDASRVRAVATQTMREAANRDEFLRLAQPVLGFPIEVISGREEARLIYVGVSHLQPSSERRLVVDIGGRSTELILGHGHAAERAESFAVGSVSLSMRFFPQGRLTSEAFRAAQIAAGAEFEEALQAFAPEHWSLALGSSGTVGAVSQILERLGWTDGRITPEALAALIRACVEAGHVDALDLTAALREDRRTVLPGGLAILYTLATHFGIAELHPAKGALRQGVIVDLHARRLAALEAGGVDVRDQTVRALQRRFGVDMAQAQRVRDLALQLLAQVQPEADQQAVRELGWAAALHEIGMAISHHDHHRHGAYLVSNLDAAGFSQSQQRRLGQLVLGQRGGLRKIQEWLDDDGFAWLILCLRLAVVKCHSREPVDGQAWVLRGRARQALLVTQPGWADAHPRTCYLLQEERQAWSRVASLGLDLDGLDG
jgi:exopolyphosphatase/guanosine-5'-triphosphate,3'-diphosphate pyrophosphatase